MTVVPPDDPLARAAVAAIGGDGVDKLTRLLVEHPEVASMRIVRDGGTSRTLLHVLADWPGHRPQGAAKVALLVAAGADVDAPFVGPHAETPLHWAASCDDVEVLDALLDAGADIEARGGAIADGTPLFDATVYGQWRAARRLVERGADSGLWEAAALGQLERVRQLVDGDHLPPSGDEVTGALWAAAHGGQRSTAEYLVDRGARIDWVGWDGLTCLDAARRSGADDLVDWLEQRGARSAAGGT